MLLFLDLKYLYRCADLLLFPSFYEGFGLPVLEAFATGTIVVTSKKGAVPEVAGEAALLADPNDPTDFAEKIMLVLSNESLRQDLKS
jgi:glycosyltransferase involved in cell wall biosynthesis